MGNFWLSVCLSLSLCLSLCLSLSVSLFASLSLCLSLCLCLSLAVCLFVCLFVCLSVCLSVSLSLSLSLLYHPIHFLHVHEGLKRSQFENKGITFKDHCEKEHNMWNYLYYIVHLRTKDKTEFTGPESYVYDQIKEHFEDSVSGR